MEKHIFGKYYCGFHTMEYGLYFYERDGKFSKLGVFTGNHANSLKYNYYGIFCNTSDDEKIKITVTDINLYDIHRMISIAEALEFCSKNDEIQIELI